MRRADFLARILMNMGTDKDCPYCNNASTKLVDRKNFILQVRECQGCGLRFRWPKETESFQEKFYQKQYQETGFTTELPEHAVLEKFKAANFAGSPKDFQASIGILRRLVPHGRVMDYGCSWGYGAFQLRNAGYDVIGFEISKPRAQFGRDELGVEILDDLSDLDQVPDNSLDGIYASHVLEHLQSLKEPFKFFARALKPGGVAMILVPNSGGRLARELGTKWTPMIGEKHTLALRRDFFEKNLPEYGFQVLALSDPYSPETIEAAMAQNTSLPSEGEELMILARRLPT